MGEFIRYVFAGGLAFGADFLTYIGLTERLGANYLVANIIGFSVGLTINYLLSIFWVFTHRSASSVKKEVLLFASIGLFNLTIGEIWLWVLVDIRGIYHVSGKIFITGLVFLSNFCMRKKAIFNVRPA